MRGHAITTPWSVPSGDTRGVVAGLATGLWLLAASGVMIWLGREQAVTIRDGWSETSRALASQPGWAMRHVLPSDARIASAIAEHLHARGRIRGLDEEVILAGDVLPADLAGQLRLSGWAPRMTTSVVSEGYLEIRAPDGTLAWRGVYQNSDFLLGAPLLRDDLALAAALAGERVPAVVPAGCATTPLAFNSSFTP